MRYILGGLVLGLSLWAQPKGISRQAYQLYLEAVRQAQAGRTAEAKSRLQEALRIEPTYEEAWVLLGKILLQSQDYPGLLEVGQKMERQKGLSAAGKAWGQYFQAKAYVAQMRYDSAEQVLRRFVVMGIEGIPKRIYEEGARLLETSVHAARLMHKPVPLKLENLGPAVNSPYPEYLPSLTADGRRLYFTSRRPQAGKEPNPLTGGYDEDLYWCERDENGRWQPAQPLGPPINSDRNEGAAFFSADGQWAFITLCDRADGLGSCDIYFSELDGDRWLPPKNLGPAVNSSAWESHPSLTHDRKRLYFASSRPGGQGGSDIWYTEWKNGAWQPPINIGPPINTPGDEYSPMIAADGRTLYFASDYHPGMGGMDLFVSYLSDTGWTTPKNLGYPLNTPGDEQTLCVDAAGRIGYVALERLEGLGKQDIYAFSLWPEIQPQRAASYVRGFVYDSLTKAPLAARVRIVDLELRDTIRALTSNRVTGEFVTSLPLRSRYALLAEAPGYLFYSQHFDLRESDQAYELRVPLEKPRKGSTIRLRNVFFEFDRADIKPESEVELLEVVRLLQAHPKWKVEVQGHTDSVGTAMYNQQLSQRRAEAVRQFLIQRGIKAERIQARGYGSSRPIAPNTTEEGRALNRRTEILFIEVD
jgi:outer membrane protein OmpA-like peptidoglycan-associated protein/tetratricopeptide (TPR) repeat protein